MSYLVNLKNDIKRNGFLYKIISREEKKAIYEQIKDGEKKGYEVFRIKIRKGRPLFNEGDHLYECFPCNDDFGKTAWHRKELEEALKIYHRL